MHNYNTQDNNTRAYITRISITHLTRTHITKHNNITLIIIKHVSIAYIPIICDPYCLNLRNTTSHKNNLRDNNTHNNNIRS